MKKFYIKFETVEERDSVEKHGLSLGYSVFGIWNKLYSKFTGVQFYRDGDMQLLGIERLDMGGEISLEDFFKLTPEMVKGSFQ